MATNTVLLSTKKERPFDDLAGDETSSTRPLSNRGLNAPRSVDIKSIRYESTTPLSESSSLVAGHRNTGKRPSTPVELDQSQTQQMRGLSDHPTAGQPRTRKPDRRFLDHWRKHARRQLRPASFVVTDYIVERWAQSSEEYISLTIAELMQACGKISNHTAHCLLWSLSRRGYLKFDTTGKRPVIYAVRPVLEAFALPPMEESSDLSSHAGSVSEDAPLEQEGTARNPLLVSDELEYFSNSYEERHTGDLEPLEEISNREAEDDFLNPDAPELLEESSNPVRPGYGLLEISSNGARNLVEKYSTIVEVESTLLEISSNSSRMEHFSNSVSSPVEPSDDQLELSSNSGGPHAYAYVCNDKNNDSNKIHNAYAYGGTGKKSFRERMAAKGYRSHTPEDVIASTQADARRPRTNTFESLKSLVPQRPQASDVPPKPLEEVYKDGVQAMQAAGIEDARPHQTVKDLKTIHEAAGCDQQVFEQQLHQTIADVGSKEPEKRNVRYLKTVLKAMLARIVQACAVL